MLFCFIRLLVVWAMILWAIPNSRLVVKCQPFCWDSVKPMFFSTSEQLGLEPLRVDLPLILLTTIICKHILWWTSGNIYFRILSWLYGPALTCFTNRYWFTVARVLLLCAEPIFYLFFSVIFNLFNILDAKYMVAVQYESDSWTWKLTQLGM
jgi:hypothetical protein